MSALLLSLHAPARPCGGAGPNRNRLLSAVLDHPDKIGVGIDEGAAVVVSQGQWEIMAGKVLLIDARHSAGGKPPAANAQLHLLTPGMTWKP